MVVGIGIACSPGESVVVVVVELGEELVVVVGETLTNSLGRGSRCGIDMSIRTTESRGAIADPPSSWANNSVPLFRPPGFTR